MPEEFFSFWVEGESGMEKFVGLRVSNLVKSAVLAAVWSAAGGFEHSAGSLE